VRDGALAEDKDIDAAAQSQVRDRFAEVITSVGMVSGLIPVQVPE
jgi:hypothetical protein